MCKHMFIYITQRVSAPLALFFVDDHSYYLLDVSLEPWVVNVVVSNQLNHFYLNIIECHINQDFKSYYQKLDFLTPSNYVVNIF